MFSYTVERISRHFSVQNFLVNANGLVTVLPKYLKFYKFSKDVLANFILRLYINYQLDALIIIYS